MTGSKNKSAGSDAMNPMNWMDDFKKLIDRFQLPKVDVAALIEWQRKDWEALTEANRQAFEGIKALAERRNEILQESLAQWQSALKDATSAEGMSKQADVAKQNIEKALANFRELAQMEMQTRNNAWKVVQDRMQENMANLQKLLKPK